MRPSPVVVRAYLLRGATLWLGARLLAAAVRGASGADPARARTRLR